LVVPSGEFCIIIGATIGGNVLVSPEARGGLVLRPAVSCAAADTATRPETEDEFKKRS
jgi:hypothetical protein